MGLQASNVALIMLMAVAFLALCAWISRLLAVNKGYDAGQGLRAGLFLGIFGIVVYLLMPERTVIAGSVDHDIAMLQGVCPGCGAETKIFAGFCTECGAQVDIEAATAPVTADAPAPPVAPAAAQAVPPGAALATTIEQAAAAAEPVAITEGICTSCGAQARFYEGFCTSCGARAGAAPGAPPAGHAQSAAATPTPVTQPVRREPVIVEKLCPGCGRIAEFRDGVCAACGAKLEA